MTETLTGAEALRYAPFTDVVVPLDDAVAQLTRRTRAVYEKNIDAYIGRIDPVDPNAEAAKAFLEVMRGDRDTAVKPGGFSVTESELSKLYAQGNSSTFRDLMRWYETQLFPKFLGHPTSRRAPGVICLGYVLDALYILKPDIATFDDGVAVVADVSRHAGSFFSPFLFGSMIDDAIHLRTGTGREAELLMDSDEVLRFQHEYFSKLSLSHKMEYLKGYTF